MDGSCGSLQGIRGEVGFDARDVSNCVKPVSLSCVVRERDRQFNTRARRLGAISHIGTGNIEKTKHFEKLHSNLAPPGRNRMERPAWDRLRSPCK